MSLKNIKSFKSFLSESISVQNLDKVSFIISKYLKKKTGKELFRMPGIEEYTSAGKKGWGIRFFIPKKNQSIRFNWVQSSLVGMANLSAVSFWNGREPKPYVITFDEAVSLVKVLPLLIDPIKTGAISKKKLYTLPDDVPLNESVDAEIDFLSEARGGDDYDPEEMLEGILEMIQEPHFKKGHVWGQYKSAGGKIFDALCRKYPDLITIQGTKYAWVGKPKDIKTIQKDSEEIFKMCGIVAGSVSRGSDKEEYRFDPKVDELEQNRERLSFEKQLDDLENLVKLTVSGASNALFVSGNGGVGKTFTTEKILSQMGLVDGDGYFKNTGSASAAGLYALLFKYRDQIVFFDDSDDALGDQEARNILKAATDTKKIRKLVWNKMGKNIADPDEMTPDEILDAGMIPRYFEFTGKIIFISNLQLNKLDPDGALRTRAFVININPTEEEIYDFMEKIMDDMPLADGLKLDHKSRKHVVDLLRKGKNKQAASLRKLSRGLSMMAGSIAAGVEVSDDELRRMIETYA